MNEESIIELFKADRELRERVLKATIPIATEKEMEKFYEEFGSPYPLPEEFNDERLERLTVEEINALFVRVLRAMDKINKK